jgi:regulatory protein
MAIKTMDKSTALNKARHLCARMEKCKAEIRQKLYEWKAEPAFHDWIIDQLTQEGFIDENRYCSYYVRDKLKFNQWGKSKIAHELKLKQIPSGLIKDSLNEIDMDVYSELCQQILQKKLNTLIGSETAKKKEKLIRFGLSRGFEGELIFKLIEKLDI